MRLFALNAGALGIFLSIGCGTYPTHVPGETRYALRSIAGNSLPAAYAQNPLVTSRVVADTIVLRDDGTGDWTAIIEDSFGGPTQRASQELTYTQSGVSISISFVCDDMGACIAPPHLVGQLTSSRIDFHLSKISRAPLVYERVGR